MIFHTFRSNRIHSLKKGKKVCIIRSQRYKNRSMMRMIISFLFQVLSTELIVGLGYSSLWLSFFYKLYIGHHIFIYFNKYTFPFIYLLLYKIYMVIIFLYILINVLHIKINYLYLYIPVHFNVLKRDFFDPVVTIKSRNCLIAKAWCCLGLYWSTRGCNLAAHSYWDEGLQDSSCLRAS